MSVFKYFFLFFALMVLANFISCSYYVQQFDKKENSRTIFQVLKSSDQKILHLSSPINDSFVTNIRSAEIAFDFFLKKFAVKKNLTFIERSVAWALIQMHVRPDQSSPLATLYIAISDHKKNQFLQFSQKNENEKNSFPYLYGLHYLLKKSSSKHDLKSLYQMLKESEVFNLLQIENPFYQELIKDQQSLAINLKKHYIINNSLIALGQTVPPLHLDDVLKVFYQNLKGQNIDISFQLDEELSQNQHQNGDDRVNCKFKNGQSFASNLFSFNRASESVTFLSMLKVESNNSILQTGFFSGTGKDISSSICSLSSSHFQGFFFSTSDHHSKEYLEKILRFKNLKKLKTPKDFAQTINRGRYLFLKRPRITLVEGDRVNPATINKLYNVPNRPLYYAPSLGNVWGQFCSKSEETCFWVLDNRKTYFLNTEELSHHD